MVCLCRVVHDEVNTPFTCSQSTWTCWDKFHDFYLPNGLFSDKGNIRRSSGLAKLKAQYRSNTNTNDQSIPDYPSIQQDPPPSSEQLPPSQTGQSPMNQPNCVARQIFGIDTDYE
ncbi:unnamed protein product [Phytophthora fragariaefolia]|uniref:Unnamed protein product n=1 Tax=Phytophthora fragariaefolia TaxID=1490495 RepID=A0A9W7D3U9_9STRA|nr:unnamed protein product [Phytophthora fragariaefolia]